MIRSWQSHLRIPFKSVIKVVITIYHDNVLNMKYTEITMLSLYLRDNLNTKEPLMLTGIADLQMMKTDVCNYCDSFIVN